MHQHFSTINKWQNRVKELKENQAAEIAKCNEVNANLQKANVDLQKDNVDLQKDKVDLQKDISDLQKDSADQQKNIADLQEKLRLQVLETENLQIALTERDEFNQNMKMEITRIKEGRLWVT